MLFTSFLYLMYLLYHKIFCLSIVFFKIFEVFRRLSTVSLDISPLPCTSFFILCTYYSKTFFICKVQILGRSLCKLTVKKCLTKVLACSIIEFSPRTSCKRQSAARHYTTCRQFCQGVILHKNSGLLLCNPLIFTFWGGDA